MSAHPLDGWDLCKVPGCPLADIDAEEPDDIDDLRESGIAHGVQHADVSDQWWIRTAPAPALAGDNRIVLAAAGWLARQAGHDYCIGATEAGAAGLWAGYQLMASDLLGSVDQATA